MTRAFPIFLALLMGGVASAQTSSRLTWKFEANKERTEIARTVTKTSMDMMGQKMDSLQEQTIWTTLKVVSVKDGVASIEKTVKRVVTTVDNPQLGKFTFDTDKKDEMPQGQGAMVAQQTLALVGSKINFTMNGKGEIDKVKVGDALQGASNGANLAQMTKQSAVVFPADLTVGKGFEQVLDMKQGGMDIKTSTTYTYKGKQKGMDKFDLAQRMNMTPGPNMPIKIKISKQTSEGTYLFDSAKGWSTKVLVSMKMTMDITTPQGAIKQDMQVTAHTIIVDGVDTKTVPKLEKGKKSESRPAKGDF
jgi:hypothetical protein